MSWISGECADDDQPATFILYEDRPDGTTETTVLRNGVVWVDSGSGPGFIVPAPDERDDQSW